MKKLYLPKENYLYFNNIQDMVEHLKSAPLAYGDKKYSTERKDEEHGSFFGGIPYREALELLEHGDEKTAKEIKEVKGVKMETTRKLQKLITDVHGFLPHVPNAVMGLPNSMVNIQSNKVNGNNKIIDLVLDADAAANVSSQEYRKVSKIFLDLVDSLEKQGYRLTLYYAINTIFDTNTKVCWLMKLKDSSEPFNKYKCAFPLGHVAMFRRIGFRLIETLDSGAAKYDVPSGYGRPNRDKVSCERMILSNLYSLNGTQPKNLKVFDVKEYVDKTQDDIMNEVLDGKYCTNLTRYEKQKLKGGE